jgi:hypothetical protein
MKQKVCYIKCWKCPKFDASSKSSHIIDGRPERFVSRALPASRRQFNKRDTVDLFVRRGTGKRVPELILAR